MARHPEAGFRLGAARWHRSLLRSGIAPVHGLAFLDGLHLMIDWERKAVEIAGRLTKTGKKIYVPLNSVSIEILKRRRAAKDAHPAHVFHCRGQKITQVVTKTWRLARNAANMPAVSLHTMCHCGQSWLAQQGVSAEMRAPLGGWSVRGLGAMDSYTQKIGKSIAPVKRIGW